MSEFQNYQGPVTLDDLKLSLDLDLNLPVKIVLHFLSNSFPNPFFGKFFDG